jgi:hypothetical protein
VPLAQAPIKSRRSAAHAQATPPGPSRPILAKTADIASVDGGSHPASSVAYILRLTVDGMALARAGANKQVLKPQTIIVRTPL